MQTNEIIIEPGNRHFLEKGLAAVFFSVFIYLIFSTLYALLIERSLGLFLGNLFQTFATGLSCLSMGIYFSMTKTIILNPDSEKLISRYSIGPFSRNVKQRLPKLEYVSVFLDDKEYFQVNLWFEKNRHYKMYAFDNKTEAIVFGEMMAKKLNIDLLDATQKGDFKWLEL